METLAISNIAQLRVEIARLRSLETEQKITLGTHFKDPAAIFNSVKSLFSKSGSKPAQNGHLHADILQTASRFIVPFTLNRTLFRHSNFLVKIFVGVISRKAANFITLPSAKYAVHKINILFKAIFNKTKPVKRLTTQSKKIS